MITTTAFACISVRSSVGLFAIMVHITKVEEEVTLTAPIELWLRVFGAVGMCLGTLLCGFRLVPVTGMHKYPNPLIAPLYWLEAVGKLTWLAHV